MHEDRRYYVYILSSISGTLYTGITNNLHRRVAEHKAGGGCGFTARYKVDRLIYFEAFKYVNNAIDREKEIKGWRRSKKVELVSAMNPSWRDLSRDFGSALAPEEASKT